MKGSPKYYREIEYVLVSELPIAQQEHILQSRELDLIKILISGNVVGPCLQYKHYSEWYHTVYASVRKEPAPEPLPVKGLVWNNA